MARPKLRRAEQPLIVRILLGLYEAVASLYLAVALIVLAAIVLAAATFVERDFGTPAVHFAIYDAWWFAAMMALLGVNVLSAAVIRFPWKKYQTGFLITHAGILLLLLGCLLTAIGGIDAQLPVFEGGTNHVAFEDSQHFTLKIHRPGEAGVGVIDVPFVSGPFNWADYASKFFFPWRIAHHDRGLICNQDGIRLAVLDYLSDSRLVRAGPLKLRVRPATAAGGSPAAWETIELGVQDVRDPHASGGAMGLGSRKRLASGLRIVYWVAAGESQTEGFRQSLPEGSLGDLGQIVLVAGGQKFPLSVEQLQKERRVPLGTTGYEVEFVDLNRQFLGVILRIHSAGEKPARMILFAEVPEFNQQDVEHGIFGSYWIDAASPLAAEVAAEAESLHNPRQPRIDVMQGTDGRLWFRAWRSPSAGPVEPLGLKRQAVTASAGGVPVGELYVESFTPQDRPGWQIQPRAFDKDRDDAMKRRQARVRLTVDGHAEEFWLEGLPASPVEAPPQPGQRAVVAGRGRRVALTLARDQVDVGFNVYLRKFQRKLDPGTSMASHYSSLVDFVDREDPGKVLEKDVLITLNEPITRRDAATGRSFRIYQEAFRGPWKPGNPLFDEMIGGKILPGETVPRDELFLSWLTVNYDPGRGLKYFGCLLIVAGIATMFYMKAYFFRPHAATADAGRQGRVRSTGESVFCGSKP